MNFKSYIETVIKGEIPVCELTRLAVERHLADLDRADWAFHFDEAQANRAINFVRLLRHTSGKFGGQPFNLQPNQAFILAMLFGWRRADGGRRFTQAYIEIARKSGKSELAAAIEIYTGFFEGEEGAQVYTAATTREQANMVFRAVKKMAKSLRRDSKAFSKQCAVMAQSVVHHPTDSFIQKVSADAGTLDGLNPHCAVIDEYHAHKTDEVKGVMQTGMGARTNPLLLIITTAGFDKNAPCFAVERKNAVAVLKGEKVQESLFSIIFTLDEGDDWQDEKVWMKANPNLGSTPTVDFLRQQVQDAVNKGTSTRVQVLTKNFNLWVDAPVVWIPDEVYKKCEAELNLEDFAGRECFAGIDLAATSDITALCLFFPAVDEQPAAALHWYFLPEATIERRAADTNYRDWVANRFICKTPGNSPDYSYLVKTICDFPMVVQLRTVVYDQWNSYETATKLSESGFEMVACRQWMGYLSAPTKKIEMMINSGEVKIQNNPVTKWMFQNVLLDRDANDNIKPNKKKSSEKIDGVSAMCMAVFGWLTQTSNVQKSYLFAENE